ncbi:acyl-CoA dehydrogenase family protein [Brevibacterium daeguense]|uniref:Acyl-CoA dehydrogenase family protein n=1 Tax=Brevibacterium daeguense TaxID=909936 RepID=A0ABP8EHV4_9MICO|nr:acyl-CoA dehydrogenase [Brevibacterium daeguense]
MSSAAHTTTTADSEFAAGLRSGVRGLGGIAAVRDNLDDPTEVRRAHRRMMDEMGLAGLLVTEELGGLDTSIRTAAALGRVAGEVPAADLLGPYVEAPVILGILHAGHPDDAVRELAARTLTTMADGGDTVTVSTDGLVFDAEASELVVVYQDESLHLVPTRALDLTELPAFDPTRTVHRIDPVSVLGAGELLAAGEIASEIAGAALVAGRVYLAAELEGTARAVLDATVEFLRSRIAFGRPLGSFQALKHQLAEMWSEVSLIGPLIEEAARALDDGEDADEAALCAAAALSFAADTAVAVCERGLQLHGGIGYTWESPVHIWLKRAAANRVRLGTPHTLRAELAALIDI